MVEKNENDIFSLPLRQILCLFFSGQPKQKSKGGLSNDQIRKNGGKDMFSGQ